MDRQGISSPVFDNNDGANNYITKASIFDLQRQMQGTQSTLRECLDNLAIDRRRLFQFSQRFQHLNVFRRNAQRVIVVRFDVQLRLAPAAVENRVRRGDARRRRTFGLQHDRHKRFQRTGRVFPRF